MLSLSHKKLDVWKLSIEFVSDIYRLTDSLPINERFLLNSQMRRAVISIASNIAEGSSRSSAKDRRRFYVIARSSCVELDTQVEIALSLNYLHEIQIEYIKSKMIRLFSMLSKLISSVK